MKQLPEYKYKWRHKPCGKIIYFTKKWLEEGDHIKSSDFVRINGIKPKEGDAIICPNCKNPIKTRNSDIEQSRRDA